MNNTRFSTEHVASPASSDYHAPTSSETFTPAVNTPALKTPSQESQPGGSPLQSPNTEQPDRVTYYTVPDHDRSKKTSQIILILGCFIPCLWWSPLYLFKNHPNPTTRKMTHISTVFAIVQTLVLLGLLGAIIYGAFDTADSTLRQATRRLNLLRG